MFGKGFLEEADRYRSKVLPVPEYAGHGVGDPR
jgi:hypothetical protein